MSPLTVKDWRDDPDHSTPITAAALEDMETRLSGYTDTVAAAKQDAATAATDTELAAGLAAKLDAAKVQAIRVTGFAITANSTTDVTVTWPVAFADTNYTVSAETEDNVGVTTAGSLIRKIVSRTASQTVVRVGTGSNAITAGQAILHAIAIHD